MRRCRSHLTAPHAKIKSCRPALLDGCIHLKRSSLNFLFFPFRSIDTSLSSI
jgi:hypothetical protein